ncbi:MAG: hypothetical protein MR842_13280 [Clostridiales bacterium]|nr:hypothetical protein [Clostridiales bacterium]MDO4349849.1 hypothetical protein [Eubacteriales bacterium]
MADAELTLFLEDWRGYSAYEIAVQHGFSGTEAEWVQSLKGEAGRDGEGITVNGLLPMNGNIALTGRDIPLDPGEGQPTLEARLSALAQALGTVGAALTEAEIDEALEQQG